MADVRNRIHGTEMEWSTVVPSGSAGSYRQASISELNPIIATYLQTVPNVKHKMSGRFLGNGSRFYADVGEHRESTTPEDDSFLGTTANEIAAERIICAALGVTSSNGNGRIDCKLPGLVINKRVVDDNNNTWGYHESYAANATGIARIHRSSLNPASLVLLGLHMATRGVFAGAGVLDTAGKFWISQKAGHLNLEFGTGTTYSNKPLVNLRHEPHADINKYVRVHVTSGDPNMSPWATRVKLGSTSLILRLIEHGVKPPNFQFEKKNQLHVMARTVAGDLALSQSFKLRDRGRATALYTQRKLINAVKRLATYVDLPDEELWTLEEWDKVITDLWVNPNRARDRVEWVLKRQHLERQREKQGLAWNSAKMRGYDRLWDSVSPRGIGAALRETVWSQWMPDESLIAERVLSPPQTTRAKIRGEFVKHFSGQAVSADWSVLSLESGSTITLDDPYETQNKTLDYLIHTHKKKL